MYGAAELKQNGITEKCFDVIHVVKMYSESKSRNADNNFLHIFHAEQEYDKGGDLFPFLFALFLYDVESFLKTTYNIGASTLLYEIVHELIILLRLLIILYADATVLLSETPENPQNQLISFLLYCQI